MIRESGPMQSFEQEPQQAASERTDKGSRTEGERSREVESLSYLQKLKEGYAGAAIKIILNDSELKPRFFDLFKDAEFLDREGAPDYRTKKITKLVTTLMRDSETRELFIESLTADMRDHSSLLKDAIFRLQDEEESDPRNKEAMASTVYDEVVIGGGVVASIYNITRSDKNPNIKSLTIEASDVVSRNFDTFRNFLRINSDNTADLNDLPSLTGSSLNTFGSSSVTQIPYFEAERYPIGGAFADVATADQFFADNEITMGTETFLVEFADEVADSKDWPAPNRITIRDVKSDKEAYVYAHRVIVASGLGKAGIPQVDDESMALMEPQIETADKTLHAAKESVEAGLVEDFDFAPPSHMMTYEQFVEYTNLAPNAFRHFAGKRIGVVGGSDSSMTVIEYFLRQSSKKALGKHVAQFGEPASLVWMGQDAKTSRDLLSKVYERYAQISLGLPGQKGKHEHLPFIEPIPGHFTSVRKSDKPKAEYDVTCKIPPLKDKEGKELISGETSCPVDYLIFTTGYEDGIGKVLGGKPDPKTGAIGNPFKNPQLSEDVKAEYPGIEEKVTVARKLKGREVYGLGATMGPLMKFEALKSGKSEKSPERGDMAITVQAMGPRTEKAAEVLATKSADHHLPRFIYPKHEMALKPDPSDSNQYTIELEKLLPTKKVDKRRMRIKLGKIFSESTLQTDGKEATFRMTVEPEGTKSNILKFNPNLDDQTGEELFRTIKGEKKLLDQIAMLVGKPGQHKKVLTLEVPYGPGGKPSIQRMNFFERGE